VPPFTANYSRLYRWLGFVLAERLNTIRRRFKHVAEVTYEALACGLPVVTTRATGSVVRDRREGRIVPERDPKALADAIEQIVEDGALRDQLAIAARQRAHEFTWEK
jgi:glycosyltransferase involved in cell wall biosynthesis